MHNTVLSAMLHGGCNKMPLIMQSSGAVS